MNRIRQKLPAAARGRPDPRVRCGRRASRAYESQDRGVGSHGGTLEMTRHYRFETVFTAAGVKVYPYGMEGKPLDATKMSGKATFYHPNSPAPWFERPLGASPGPAPVSLECTINLSKVPASGVKVAFEVGGLPDPAEPSASITVPFALAPTPAPARPAPAPAPAAITYAGATRADQPAIDAQRVCAVTRKPLGSMGTPVKVTRGDRGVFLCCLGCLGKVTANPDLYFGAAR